MNVISSFFLLEFLEFWRFLQNILYLSLLSFTILKWKFLFCWTWIYLQILDGFENKQYHEDLRNNRNIPKTFIRYMLFDTHATESHRVDSRQFLAHSFWFAIHLSGFFFKNRPTLKLPLCFKSFLPILVAKRIQPTGWNLVDWTWLLDQNDIRTCGHDGSEILWFPECCNDWQEHKLIYNIFKWWFGMRKYKYMGRLGTIQEVHSKHEFKKKRS